LKIIRKTSKNIFIYSHCTEKALAQVSAFFNEIRLTASEILLRDVKYADAHEIFVLQMWANFITQTRVSGESE